MDQKEEIEVHMDEESPKSQEEQGAEHSKIVAQHYNSLKERGLAERYNSKIFYMRNFNNWVKSMLISDYLQKLKDSMPHRSPLRVLDMCCGKGGDLLKWQKGGITHLICTDIADVSVEQCKARYEKITSSDPPDRKSFQAEFFTSDSTRDNLRKKYIDKSIDLNLVSCQFAFHYCFESPKQAETMLKNVSECLKPGGYFIGTIPDAYDIMRRQKAAGSDTFGNDVFEIKFLSDPDDLPVFGAKYNFHLDGVVDCPEFLVYFPAFEKLAKEYSLKLVEKVRFEDYFEAKRYSGRGLIEKMQALEQYGMNNSGNPPRTNDKEYEHVNEFLIQNGGYNNQKRAGTLSKSEWEATTLYMVFAFQKVKAPLV